MRPENPIPVDRTAANVIRPGFSEEFVPKNDGPLFSDVFIKGKKADEGVKNKRFDLTGLKFGQMTVVEYYGGSNRYNKNGKSKYKTGGARWVCRCSCGNYEVRKGKAIRKMVKGTRRREMCQECRELEKIQHKEFKRLTGKWPHEV